MNGPNQHCIWRKNLMTKPALTQTADSKVKRKPINVFKCVYLSSVCVYFLKLLGCLCSDSKNVFKLENCSGEIQSTGCSEVLKLGPRPDEFVTMTLKLIPKNNRHISEINSSVCFTKFPISVTMTTKWKICSLLNQQEHMQRPTKQ